MRKEFETRSTLTIGNNRPGQRWKSNDKITQPCECCHEWVNQEELVWDLEEDRLVCGECYNLPNEIGVANN